MSSYCRNERGSIEHGDARMIAEDALSELLASGLVHRLERFVFASRAAIRAQGMARQQHIAIQEDRRKDRAPSSEHPNRR